MNNKVLSLIILCMLLSYKSKAQQTYVNASTKDTIRVGATNMNGEIVPWIVLQEVIVSDKRRFKSKEEYDKYRRLRYNVLKVLPYARYAGQRYRQLERDLATTVSKKDHKVMVKKCEKEVKDLFNSKIKDLTISQGEVLIKLIDRETNNSSFELVKDIKGGVPAFFMQSVARIFGHDLKAKYDPDEDREIENIIRSTGYYSYQ